MRLVTARPNETSVTVTRDAELFHEARVAAVAASELAAIESTRGCRLCHSVDKN